MEVDREREECDSVRRELRQKMDDLQVDLQLQRDLLTAQFEDTQGQQMQDSSAKISDLRSKLLQSDSLASQMRKEIDALRAKCQRIEGEKAGQGEELVAMETRLREREWELGGVAREREARVCELEEVLEGVREGAEQQQAKWEQRCASCKLYHSQWTIYYYYK